MLNSTNSDPKATADPVLATMAVGAFAMTMLVGVRSGPHILRIQYYIRTLALRLQRLRQFAPILTEPYIQILFQAAALYDMGTIGIPDRILLKPGRLTPAEFEIMKTHTTMARDAIEQAEKALGFPVERVRTLKELACSHHEKWDGSGYPQGLVGTQIPLAARLLAVADVYDALVSNQVYKAGVAHEQAVVIIFQNRGSHFDPDVVDAFLEIEGEFQVIAQRYADTDLDMQKMIEYTANAIAEETSQYMPLLS